jgi:hypothetical protein
MVFFLIGFICGLIPRKKRDEAVQAELAIEGEQIALTWRSGTAPSGGCCLEVREGKGPDFRVLPFNSLVLFILMYIDSSRCIH